MLARPAVLQLYVQAARALAMKSSSSKHFLETHTRNNQMTLMSDNSMKR